MRNCFFFAMIILRQGVSIFTAKRCFIGRLKSTMKMSHGLEETFFRHISETVKPGSYVLMSVSGGVDSMALLHLMVRINSFFDPKLKLEVVTFHHKLRAAADEEVEFVKKKACEYQIPLQLRVVPETLNLQTGTQAKSREWRRSECLKIIEKQKNLSLCDEYLIATAHHGDDQLETILLKLLRGVHLSRISPMQARSGNFIKPLLSISKNELKDFMMSNNYEWKDDESNESRKYKRNKVRLDLIPLMAEMSGGGTALKRRLNNLVDQSAQVRQWLEQQTNTFLEQHARFKARDGGGSSVAMAVGPGSAFEALPTLAQTDVVQELCRRLPQWRPPHKEFALPRQRPPGPPQSANTITTENRLGVVDDDEGEGEGEGQGGCGEKAYSYDTMCRVAALARGLMPAEGKSKCLHLSGVLRATRRGDVLWLDHSPLPPHLSPSPSPPPRLGDIHKGAGAGTGSALAEGFNMDEGIDGGKDGSRTGVEDLRRNEVILLHNGARADGGGNVCSATSVSVEIVGLEGATVVVDVCSQGHLESKGLDQDQGEREAGGGVEEVKSPLLAVDVATSSAQSAVVTLCGVPMGCTITLRPCAPGDKFHPPWRNGATSVKGFLRGQRVPSHLRGAVVVLAMRRRSGAHAANATIKGIEGEGEGEGEGDGVQGEGEGVQGAEREGEAAGFNGSPQPGGAEEIVSVVPWVAQSYHTAPGAPRHPRGPATFDCTIHLTLAAGP